MKIEILKRAIDLIENSCTNMIGIENAILDASLKYSGGYKSDLRYKVERILFRKIPKRFHSTIMYTRLSERLTTAP